MWIKGKISRAFQITRDNLINLVKQEWHMLHKYIIVILTLWTWFSVTRSAGGAKTFRGFMSKGATWWSEPRRWCSWQVDSSPHQQVRLCLFLYVSLNSYETLTRSLMTFSAFRTASTFHELQNIQVTIRNHDIKIMKLLNTGRPAQVNFITLYNSCLCLQRYTINFIETTKTRLGGRG